MTNSQMEKINQLDEAVEEKAQNRIDRKWRPQPEEEEQEQQSQDQQQEQQEQEQDDSEQEDGGEQNDNQDQPEGEDGQDQDSGQGDSQQEQGGGQGQDQGQDNGEGNQSDGQGDGQGDGQQGDSQDGGQGETEGQTQGGQQGGPESAGQGNAQGQPGDSGPQQGSPQGSPDGGSLSEAKTGTSTDGTFDGGSISDGSISAGQVDPSGQQGQGQQGQGQQGNDQGNAHSHQHDPHNPHEGTAKFDEIGDSSIEIDPKVKKDWEGAMGGMDHAEFDEGPSPSSGSSAKSGRNETSDEHKVKDGQGQVSLPEEPADVDNEEEYGEKFAVNHGSWSEYTEGVEDQIAKVAYSQNDDDVGTNWTPEKVEDRHIANMFGLIVSKLAEDQSYDKTDGDAYWDTRELMRRQVTKQNIYTCKHDYERERLALLIDTSPSCKDEAVFYSKIAYGAMLRSDIDLYCAPNGRIDGKFSMDHMRFLHYPIKGDWREELEGRIVLFFSDWDGKTVLENAHEYCNVYWFDNVPDRHIGNYSQDFLHTEFSGQRHYCPDKHKFLRLARKIRP